ncbi:hypothetical protein IFM47457_11059 [Aspergillus lentulus]|nr:hypothetical protein IFM47457_11059 [Aspergillus lentulus]
MEAVVLSIILFTLGGLNRGAVNNPDKTEQYGTGAAAMVFLYVVVFSSSWLMIPFIYPTEILPTRLRAKGNAFGVAVWAVGYGAGSLLVPVMIAGIHEKTAGRSLEQIDFLFASKSPFVWDEEKVFTKRMTQFNAEIQKMEIENGGYGGGEKTREKFVEKV